MKSLLSFLLMFGFVFVFSQITFPSSYAQTTTGNIAVGALGKDVGGVDGVGTVYVFNGTSNSLLRIINNPDGNIHGQFSEVIAYKDNKLVISAPWKHNDKNKAEGAVYILDGTSASLVKTMPTPNPNQDEFVDGFGSSMTFAGNTIVLGAPNHHVNNIKMAGAVYVFDNSGFILQTILNPDPSEGDSFGGSVAALGNNIVVGIPNKKINDVNNAGAVSIFDTSTGSILRTINNPEPVDHAKFGWSVATSGNKLLVGAPYATVNGENRVGVVYLFDANTGSLIQTIQNPDPDDEDDFGFSVMFADNKIVVGAPGNSIYHSGSVHIFYADTGLKIRTLDNPQTILPPQSGYTNEFGGSITYKESKLVVGDRGKIINGLVNAGGVYVYDINTGALLETIDNPSPAGDDAFGGFVAFVGNMNPGDTTLVPDVNNSTNPKISNVINSEEDLKISDSIEFEKKTNTTKPPPEEDKVTEQFSPLKQFKSGIPAQAITCKQGLQSIMKINDGSPACVRYETAIKLVNRGWAHPFWISGSGEEVFPSNGS